MIKENIMMYKKWTIKRFNNKAEAEQGKPPEYITDADGNVLPGESVFGGNVLLNEGINNVLGPVLTGTGSPTVYDNANARLGVGDGTTSASASQTGLQGSNTTFTGMKAGYPTFSSQVAAWEAEFGGTEANHSWQEFTVVNAADDTGDNLNRKVSDQGSKASGQVWTLNLQITFS